jgi:hypothetical protein
MAILNIFKLEFKGDNGYGLMEEGWGLQVGRTRRPERSSVAVASEKWAAVAAAAPGRRWRRQFSENTLS